MNAHDEQFAERRESKMNGFECSKEMLIEGVDVPCAIHTTIHCTRTFVTYLYTSVGSAGPGR